VLGRGAQQERVDDGVNPSLTEVVGHGLVLVAHHALHGGATVRVAHVL
jgi:hypothetical protein